MYVWVCVCFLYRSVPLWAQLVPVLSIIWMKLGLCVASSICGCMWMPPMLAVLLYVPSSARG